MTPQLYLFLKKFQRFIGHHHPIIFFIIITLLLSVAIFSLYQIFTTSFAKSTETAPTIGSFDKKTIERIRSLQTSSNSSDETLVFPTPRSNPFNE